MDDTLPGRNEVDRDTAEDRKEQFKSGFMIEKNPENSMLNKADYHTPISRGHNDSHNKHTGQTVLSCLSRDSGFSDRSFISSWSSCERNTPHSAFSYSSIPSSANSETRDTCQKSLADNGFSPEQQHPTSLFRGKQLQGRSYKIPPPPFPSLDDDHIDGYHTAQASPFSEDNSGDDNNMRSTGELAMTQQADDRESPSSSLSHSQDTLENSLQEMSLEESSSSSSEHSPVHLRLESSKFVFPMKRKSDRANLSSSSQSSGDEPDGHLTMTEEESFSESDATHRSKKTEVNDNEATVYDKTQSKFETELPPSSVTCLVTNISTTLSWSKPKEHQTDREQQEFLSGFSLTPAQAQKSQVSKTSHMKCKRFPQSGSTHEHFASPDHQELYPTHSRETGSPAVEPTTARVPPLPHQYDSQDLHETLGRWETAHRSNYHDKSSMVSPVKSPNKRCYNPDLEKDSPSLFSPTKAQKKLIPTSSKHQSPKKKASLCRSPHKNVVRKILNNDQDTDQNHYRINYGPLLCNLSPVYPFYNTDHLPIAITPEYVTGQDNCTDHPAMVENMLWDNSQPTDLHSMMNTCSPSQPSGLIGRNIGVQKFDIIDTLSQRNFFLCLEKIFQHLDVSELVSMQQVSLGWKTALLGAHKAHGRYLQYVKDLRLLKFQHGDGKENCGEKPADDYNITLLTTSRGLLTSRQSQAAKPLQTDQPSTSTQTKDLLSDDKLRPCPQCQGPAVNKPLQKRAICIDNKCDYDFCILCFETFHHPKPCKPLCKNASNAEVAGTRKSRKNLRRL